MDLESKIKRCLLKRKEFLHCTDELHIAVITAMEKNMSAKISIEMGQEKSYVKKTLSRPIKIDNYPANFLPLIKIAQAFIKSENKKRDLEKI